MRLIWDDGVDVGGVVVKSGGFLLRWFKVQNLKRKCSGLLRHSLTPKSAHHLKLAHDLKTKSNENSIKKAM